MRGQSKAAIHAALQGASRNESVFAGRLDTPGEVRWVGPELGEHTDEVLAEALDLDEAARSALRDAGVI